jgi:hypothetical protein
LTLLSKQFEQFASAFETCGDKYYAGNAWLYRSLCLDEAHQGPTANLRDVAAAYRKLVDLRKDIALDDRAYKETVPILKRLEALGHGSTGENGEAAEPVLNTSGAAIVATTAFEPVTSVDEVPRPNYDLDEQYPIWNNIRFAEVGSSARIAGVEGAPALLRSGANKIEIDVDGDGKGDREVPTRGKLEFVEMELGSGATKRKWGFLAQMGNQTDQYQGVELSNAASDENWSVFIAPGASMVADLGGTKLQVFDDNMDGKYGSAPYTPGRLGLSKGIFQSEFDTMLIGEAKRAVPWSQYARFPAGWMKLESLSEGAQISATPTEVKTRA